MSSGSAPNSIASPESRRPLRVGILLARNFTLSAFALFVDTLRLASDEQDKSGRKYVDWDVLNDTGQLMQSSSGVQVAPTARLSERKPYDCIAVVGGRLNVEHQLSDEVMTYLKNCAAKGTSIIGLCTGSFVLAEAGLLKGRTACVSWLHREEFQQAHPDIAVVSHQLFLGDGHITTCAGGTAVADLAAWIVKKHVGERAAKNAMEILQLDRHRVGTDMQARLPHSYQAVHEERVKQALLLMDQAASGKSDIASIARLVGVSSRQLERLFKQELAETPVSAFQAIKLDKARLLVEKTRRTVLQIALEFGYESQTHFSRVFKKRFGMNPGEMRSGSASADLVHHP